MRIAAAHLAPGAVLDTAWLRANAACTILPPYVGESVAVARRPRTFNGSRHVGFDVFCAPSPRDVADGYIELDHDQLLEVS